MSSAFAFLAFCLLCSVPLGAMLWTNTTPQTNDVDEKASDGFEPRQQEAQELPGTLDGARGVRILPPDPRVARREEPNKNWLQVTAWLRIPQSLLPTPSEILEAKIGQGSVRSPGIIHEYFATDTLNVSVPYSSLLMTIIDTQKWVLFADIVWKRLVLCPKTKQGAEEEPMMRHTELGNPEEPPRIFETKPGSLPFDNWTKVTVKAQSSAEVVYLDEDVHNAQRPPSPWRRPNQGNLDVDPASIRLDTNGRRYVERYTKQRLMVYLNGTQTPMSLWMHDNRGGSFFYSKSANKQQRGGSLSQNQAGAKFPRTIKHTEEEDRERERQRKRTRKYYDEYEFDLEKGFFWEANSVYTVGMSLRKTCPWLGELRVSVPHTSQGRAYFVESCQPEIRSNYLQSGTL